MALCLVQCAHSHSSFAQARAKLVKQELESMGEDSETLNLGRENGSPECFGLPVSQTRFHMLVFSRASMARYICLPTSVLESETPNLCSKR